MAQQHEHATPPQDPRAFWEARYGGDQVWSGKVNAALAALAEGLPPGRALDLGCGEGGDVIHLAEVGWDATGVDLAEAAVARARRAAQERGVAERTRFVAADLSDTASGWGPPDDAAAPGFDLVAASFLQSPVALDRERILRHALTLLTPGGRLVLVSHAAPPPWAPAEFAARGHFPSPTDELAMLGVPASGDGTWDVEVAEERTREVTGPDGQPGALEDAVVVVRRR